MSHGNKYVMRYRQKPKKVWVFLTTDGIRR
jgi:hypothetical protein